MPYISLKKGQDGIVDLILDQPGKSVNVMGNEYDVAMKKAVRELKGMADSIKGVYLRSGKPGTFFAGGDVKAMLQMDLNMTPDERSKMLEALMETKQALRDLETLGVSVAVGINGVALGGGYELCLATHYRVALRQPNVQIGLPEATLGLMPGADGVVRLTRLLGCAAALPLISQGRRLRPQAALDKGLIHELADDEQDMERKAKKWILANPGAKQPWDEKSYKIPGGVPGESKSQEMQGLLFFGPVAVMNQTQGLMPAQKAIFATIAETAMVDFATAQKIEARYFQHLLLHQTSRNMMTAFFSQMNDINSGISRPKGIDKKTFKKIGVLGAGQMGAGIAFAASKVGIEVILKDQSMDMAEKGRAYSQTAIEKNKRIDDKQGKEIMGRIHVSDEYAAFSDCEVVVEAVFEDAELKAQVIPQAEEHLGNAAIFASNTSALPITGLAESSRRPKQFIGMHFFSPAERMPLVEIICGKQTSDSTLAAIFDLAKQLGKTPIVVNDGPGFFTSRVIGKMISQSLCMLAEGVDPVVLENAIKQAGYPVSPLALVDEISQLTSYRIMQQRQEAAKRAGKQYTTPRESEVVRRMVEDYDRKGKVHGGGFYEYPKDGKKYIWPELRDMFADGKGRDMPLSDIQDRVMYAEMLEAIHAHEEGVINNVADGNIGSIMGIGFPAHTGGVFQGINAIGLKAFVERCKELQQRYGDEFKPPPLLLKKASSDELFL
jgi:3-hydroxyacyl-CoA dehydrogenase/enoyl-CoA hydratase/3-hydroxybutyryl-CoA epimerase